MGDNSTERRVLLSALPASQSERRLAYGVILASVAAFAVIAPFAQVKLPPVAAFIPIYQSALTLNDLITAALLFCQFGIARQRSLLVLACGYVFTAGMTVAHTLSFPGLFAPSGLLGAGPQTTAWLYMFWHGGFPLAVIVYTLLDRGPDRLGWPQGRAIVASVLATLLVVVGLMALTTVGQSLLPSIMEGNGYTPVMIFVISSVWALSCLALVFLWLRRPHSVLDIWLMVVMCAWLFDIALSAVLNAGRYDLGFYAGRIYGLMAASFVLMVLMAEITALYSRLARSMAAERDQRERRLREAQALLAHVSRSSEIGHMAPALTHEMNQPLTAIMNYLEAGRGLLQAGQSGKAEEAMQKASEQVHRAGQILARLRTFLAREDPERNIENVGDIVTEANALASASAKNSDVDIVLKFEPAISEVVVDKIQVQQVLLNLIRNAVGAMADGPRRNLTIAAASGIDGMVEVSVADTGSGLSPEVRAKLFQPFTSTKAGGMGVGLSICRIIIESHGGRLWADDNVDGGTIFRFTLPGAGRRQSRRDTSAAA